MLLRLSVFVVCALLCAGGLHATSLRVPALFGDNACVQAGQPLAVWGWSDPASKVTITLDKSSVETTTDADGRWQAELPGIPVGGPYVLSVQSGDQTVTSKNIVAGEVWLASGQSNMFWPLTKTEHAARDIPTAGNDQLRLFRSEIIPSFDTASEPRGKWEVCTPESVAEFSGVAYYFGRKLQKDLNVPVGMIQVSLGGTPIEGWLPPELWKESAEFKALRKVQEGKADDHARKTYERLFQKWKKRGSPAGKEPPKPDYAEVDQNDPSVCFNVGIAPLAPYTLTGFLWYQGEWNTGRAEHYDKLLTQLVGKWRKLWGGTELPFYVVQLPNIGKEPSEEPVDFKSGWAALREEQATVLKLPNTGLAVTIDLGGELHPPQKLEVGERLARIALAQAYKRDIPALGPSLTEAKAEGGKLILTFANADGLTLTPAHGRTGFALAGDDKIYHAANATVEGEKILLSTPAVPAPKFVRYLWAQNPQATVYNSAGLPAGPFRTDSWENIERISSDEK